MGPNFCQGGGVEAYIEVIKNIFYHSPGVKNNYENLKKQFKRNKINYTDQKFAEMEKRK